MLLKLSKVLYEARFIKILDFHRSDAAWRVFLREGGEVLGNKNKSRSDGRKNPHPSHCGALPWVGESGWR